MLLSGESPVAASVSEDVEDCLLEAAEELFDDELEDEVFAAEVDDALGLESTFCEEFVGTLDDVVRPDPPPGLLLEVAEPPMALELMLVKSLAFPTLLPLLARSLWSPAALFGLRPFLLRLTLLLLAASFDDVGEEGGGLDLESAGSLEGSLLLFLLSGEVSGLLPPWLTWIGR